MVPREHRVRGRWWYFARRHKINSGLLFVLPTLGTYALYLVWPIVSTFQNSLFNPPSCLRFRRTPVRDPTFDDPTCRVQRDLESQTMGAHLCFERSIASSCTRS